eukprot:SAG22_NODE_12112_length_456_cov_0.574230_2_plen_71_part_00
MRVLVLACGGATRLGQAAAFPGFLFSGWLVDHYGWYRRTVNIALLAALVSLGGFTYLLAATPDLLGPGGE